MSEFKVGDVVRFIDEAARKDFPTLFPPVGTVGKVTKIEDSTPEIYTVQWFPDNAKRPPIKDSFVFAERLELVESGSTLSYDKVLIMVDKHDPMKIVARDLSSNKTGEAHCHPGDKFDFSVGALIALGRLFGHEPEITVDAKLVTQPCKFKVGDKIIGNANANRYGITREGWIGVVNEILSEPEKGGGCDEGLTVTFIAEGKDGALFWLSDDAFDLYEEPEYFTGKLVCVESDYGFWTVGKVYQVANGVIRDDEGDRRNNVTSAEEVSARLTMPHHTVKFIELKE